jgi:lipoprotein-releasing system permease protein
MLIRSVVMLVVVLGIASVLVVSVVQKQREIGILRAMGTTRAQILRVFLLQGVLVAALGSLLGRAAGCRTDRGLHRLRQGLRRLALVCHHPGAGMALQIVLMTGVAGVLAAVAPARRAAYMDPAQAIRSVRRIR